VSGATACAFLDPAHLLTGGGDGVVRLWDLPARTAATLWQDAAAIRALAVVAGEVAISSQNGAMTVDPAAQADPVILNTGEGHVDTMVAAREVPVLITGSTNDVAAGAPCATVLAAPPPRAAAARPPSTQPATLSTTRAAAQRSRLRARRS
jgi:hypothetical protein